MKKSALLAVAWNSDDWTFEALETHYKTLVRYLNLTDCGCVLGKGKYDGSLKIFGSGV